MKPSLPASPITRCVRYPDRLVPGMYVLPTPPVNLERPVSGTPHLLNVLAPSGTPAPLVQNVQENLHSYTNKLHRNIYGTSLGTPAPQLGMHWISSLLNIRPDNPTHFISGIRPDTGYGNRMSVYQKSRISGKICS